MSVSLRFHLFQRRDNRMIRETLGEILRSVKEEAVVADSDRRKKSRQLSIHEIDALSKRLTFRKGTRSQHGSLMDELFDEYDLGEFSVEEPKVPELVTNGECSSDSDTDVASMASSSASSIIRDDFVFFAKSLRRKQFGDDLSSNYSLTSRNSVVAYD